jgi:hypothetical protein
MVREVYFLAPAEAHRILHDGIWTIDENFICPHHACSFMAPKKAPKKQRRKKTESLTFGAITEMLSTALKNHDDFILTWEPRRGEEVTPETKQEIHIMTGNLITSCRLNNLKSRVLLYEDEGARIVSRVWD